MFKWILSLLFLISTNTYALDISLQGAKVNHENYSTLHVKDKNKFLCQEIKNDFEVTTEIICAFSTAPSQKLSTIQNNFFTIETKTKKNTFFLIIKPYKKMKLFPVVFNLSEEDEVYAPNVKLSNHWMIVGYNKEVPFMKDNEAPEVAINFPFFLDKDKLPYVGSLDIKGNPVHIKEADDVTSYLKIKEYYKDKKYEKCLDLLNEIMAEYPHSLFNAELLYYKIKTNDKLGGNEVVINLSKIYLREYSSDENVAEILSLTAKAYSKASMSSQADYFYDRLFDEHADSPYAKWGYIYKGEMLEASGYASKAIEFYKRAISETSNLDIAITAAYKLARYYIGNGEKKEASKYVEKIIKVQNSYFAKEFLASMDMMQSFADEGEYAIAGAIAKAVVEHLNKEHDEYEKILKDEGIWLSKSPNKQEALTALNEYLSVFSDGLYEEEVQTAKDSLFFDMDDSNLTTKLNDYENLIQTYAEDSIGNRAIYEKAKLLQENKMFSDVLAFRDDLLALDAEIYPDSQAIVDSCAKGAMEQALDKRECSQVLEISTDYSIELSDKWDDGIYECAMKGADFELAKSITSKNLKSKDLDIRKKWLYRYIKIDFATGNYSDVVKASQELVTLIDSDKDSEYKDIYRILFDTYYRLENQDKMIDTITKIQKVYGSDYKDIERYIAVMAIGSQRKDDNLVLQYGQEVVKIQNSSQSNAQSPFVEFTMYQSYINKLKYNQALDIMKSLDSVEIEKSDRARQKYLLGSIYEKLWRDEEAQKSYEEAIEADSSSAWAKLAKGAKD